MTRFPRYALLLVPLAVVGGVLSLSDERADEATGIAAVPSTGAPARAPAPAKAVTLRAPTEDTAEAPEPGQDEESGHGVVEGAEAPAVSAPPPRTVNRAANVGAKPTAPGRRSAKRGDGSKRTAPGMRRANRTTPAMRGTKLRGPNARGKGTPTAPPKGPGKATVTAPVAPMKALRPNKNIRNEGRKIHNPERKAKRKS